MVHLSKLRPRICSSRLLPPNQRLLGQRHDKLCIPEENIITWVPTPTNRCRSRIRAQTNAYLSLPVEHASSDETPTTVRRWALDLFTGRSDVYISISRGLICIDELMYNRSIAYHIQQPVVSLHRLVEPDATDSDRQP